MLEQTYAYLLESSADAARQRLDAFSARLDHERPSSAIEGDDLDGPERLDYGKRTTGIEPATSGLGSPRSAS